MIYENNLSGRYVELRSANVSDADFTLNIRLDPDFKKYFPDFKGTPETQANWIRSQREKSGDYFFVIWDIKNNSRIGTISVYDFHDGECEGGRLAVKSSNPFHSVEAQLLADKFAFEILGVNKIHAYVFADNTRALNFSRLFGNVFEPAKFDPESNREIVHVYRTLENFNNARKKIEAMLYR